MRGGRRSLGRLSRLEWVAMVGLVLAAWALRLCLLEEVPPGWRDDELINIHALSGRLFDGEFPIYFTGASGHEPLYHYLLAGVHAVWGCNVLSGHISSVAFGVLSIPLTFVLARRLLGRDEALIAAAGLTTSFWSLMYSRTAIRHISLPFFVLLDGYLLWRFLERRRRSMAILLGLAVGVSIYTYTASRLLPMWIAGFAIYLALFHRRWFNGAWRGVLLALLIAGVVVLPLAVAIAQGRSEAAAEGIGADARLAELAVPIRELRKGNVRPLLETTWTTLGMFHATGDSEWLYNLPGRPVFGVVGAVFFGAGVLICLIRWRDRAHAFLLLWLGLGLTPAFLSYPPASLGHTIFAQPVAYILPALAIVEGSAWLRKRTERVDSRLLQRLGRGLLPIFALAFLSFTAVRDVRDYFVTWPVRGMVGVLYRSDYRDAAFYFNAHPEVDDVAIGSSLMGPWDQLALSVDVDEHRDDLAVRFFNPERALVWASGDDEPSAILTTWPDPAPALTTYLEEGRGIADHLTLHPLEAHPAAGEEPLAAFKNGLSLVAAEWLEGLDSGGSEAVLETAWRVDGPLDLPPMPIVANPPPPGVYSGPRLSVFSHLLSGGEVVADDGLWVDPLTLRPGDVFVQLHRFELDSSVSGGEGVVELGLYDPKTGERWGIMGGSGRLDGDRVLFE